jgi:hypothetical protein
VSAGISSLSSILARKKPDIFQVKRTADKELSPTISPRDTGKVPISVSIWNFLLMHSGRTKGLLV